MNATKFIAACAISTVFSAAFSVNLQAQQLYRIVGADGRVTFSDQPPAVGDTSKVTSGRAGRFGEEGATSPGLPAELRAVVARYPVILYSTKECIPCAAGRNVLQSRGIPFTEKTIENQPDADALIRLTGESSLPALSIGGQQIKGFSQLEWTQYLDAAGYPKTSALPGGYRNPEPSPIVARVAAPSQAAAAAAAAEPAATQRPAAPPPGADNPAGIRF